MTNPFENTNELLARNNELLEHSNAHIFLLTALYRAHLLALAQSGALNVRDIVRAFERIKKTIEPKMGHEIIDFEIALFEGTYLDNQE